MPTRISSLQKLGRIHSAIDEDFPVHLEQCRNFLKQKSISATAEGIRETADMVGTFIRKAGDTADFWGNASVAVRRMHAYPR